MPTGTGEEERFAAAVGSGANPAVAGRGDERVDSLARDLEIVALLRAGGPALAPDPAARAQAKRRLMAAFAQEFAPDVPGVPGAAETTATLRPVSAVALAEREPAGPTAPTPLRRPDAGTERAPRRPGRHAAPESDEDTGPGTVTGLETARSAAERRRGRRGGLVGAAAAAVLVTVAGSAMFASTDALPGDALYGVKRVAESTGLALTFDEQAKARRHLERAQRRLDEVEGLVTRSRTASGSASASGSGSAGTSGSAMSDPELVRGTMQDFGIEASEGSRLLLAGSPTTPPDTEKVDEVRSWAAEQSGRLSDLRSTLPAPDQADESLALLDRLLDETDALREAACRSDGSVSTGVSGSVDVGCTPPVDTPTPVDPSDPDAPEGRAGADAEASTSTGGRRGDAEAEATAGTSPEGTSSGVGTRTTTSGGSNGPDGGRGEDPNDDGSDSSDDLHAPLPVQGTVDVPPLAPGLPGVNLGG